MSTKRSDTERLDALQSLTDRSSYTGKVKLRLSRTGRGWRLHETGLEGSSTNVRQAIDNFLDERIGNE